MTDIIEKLIDPEMQSIAKSIDEIYFVCLFSIICFGQKLISLYSSNSGLCLKYDHPSGSISLKCAAGFKFETLNETNIHTLAIYGKPLHFNYLSRHAMCNLSAKNLILENLSLPISTEQEDYGKKCGEMSHSLTLIEVEFTYNPDTFPFYHIYIERSDLTIPGSLAAVNLPSQLRSLSLVSCLIKDLPQGIFSHTKSLQMLTITRNSLKSFTSNYFGNNVLESLWFLDLSFNRIDHISADMTAYFPNLAEINLQSNHIQVLPEQTFFKKWIEIDIVNLDANALICQKLAWSINLRPHPIFFDSAKCNTKDFNEIPIGTLYLSE